MTKDELIRIINDPALHDTLDCSDDVFEGIDELCSLIKDMMKDIGHLLTNEYHDEATCYLRKKFIAYQKNQRQ